MVFDTFVSLRYTFFDASLHHLSVCLSVFVVYSESTTRRCGRRAICTSTRTVVRRNSHAARAIQVMPSPCPLPSTDVCMLILCHGTALSLSCFMILSSFMATIIDDPLLSRLLERSFGHDRRSASGAEFQCPRERQGQRGTRYRARGRRRASQVRAIQRRPSNTSICFDMSSHCIVYVSNTVCLYVSVLGSVCICIGSMYVFA